MKCHRPNYRYDVTMQHSAAWFSLREYVAEPEMNQSACWLCRLTDILPVRSVPFIRGDSLIGLTKPSGRETMALFEYSADVPYSVVVAVSLSLPVVVVSTSHICCFIQVLLRPVSYDWLILTGPGEARLVIYLDALPLSDKTVWLWTIEWRLVLNCSKVLIVQCWLFFYR